MPILRLMAIQDLRENLRVNFCVDSDLCCHPEHTSSQPPCGATVLYIVSRKMILFHRDATELDVFRKDIKQCIIGTGRLMDVKGQISAWRADGYTCS